MNAPASEPKLKRSRRMVLWLVVVPVVLLLLALAGANWKTFHLAYAKHLIASDDPEEQYKGVSMVMYTHLREGMSLKETRRLLAPARVTESGPGPMKDTRYFDVTAGEKPRIEDFMLILDKNDRLFYLEIARDLQRMSKRELP